MELEGEVAVENFLIREGGVRACMPGMQFATLTVISTKIRFWVGARSSDGILHCITLVYGLLRSLIARVNFLPSSRSSCFVSSRFDSTDFFLCRIFSAFFPSLFSSASTSTSTSTSWEYNFTKSFVQLHRGSLYRRASENHRRAREFGVQF